MRLNPKNIRFNFEEQLKDIHLASKGFRAEKSGCLQTMYVRGDVAINRTSPRRTEPYRAASRNS